MQNWNAHVHTFLFVQFKFLWPHADKHTHASCNAVPLVWGLLRLAPMKCTMLPAWDLHCYLVIIRVNVCKVSIENTSPWMLLEIKSQWKLLLLWPAIWGFQSSPWSMGYLHTFILQVDPLVSWNGPTLIDVFNLNSITNYLLFVHEEIRMKP